MSNQIDFTVIADGYSQRVNCTATSNAETHKFIKKSLDHLEPGQWLLAEPSGDFPWGLVGLLTDLPLVEEDFDDAASELAVVIRDSTLVENGLPQFDFEHTRLVFRHPTFQNPSSIGILGTLEGTPFLACEQDFDSSFGVVSMREIASYEYFQDSTGVPVSWSGGARLVQVNSASALSFGTGDSASEPEALDWTLEGELDDEHAKVLLAWLDEYNLVTPLAWLTTSPGKSHEDSNLELLREIIGGDSSGLTLALDLTPRELELVIEYCPQVSNMFLPIREMLRSNKDNLLRDLFIYFGLSGMLFDGGRQLEEAYLSFNSARRVIQEHYVVPLSPEEDLPTLARTRAVISRLENILVVASSAEKIRILTQSDDQGLRIAGILAAREEGEFAQDESITRLLKAFKGWEDWRSLEEHLPALKEYAGDKSEDYEEEN